MQSIGYILGVSTLLLTPPLPELTSELQIVCAHNTLLSFFFVGLIRNFNPFIQNVTVLQSSVLYLRNQMTIMHFI